MPVLNIPPDCPELGRRSAAFDEVADYAAHDQNENEQRQKPRPPAVSCEQHINPRFRVRPINGAASNSSMYRAAGKRKLSPAPASSCLRAPRPTSTRRCHRRQHHPAFFLDRRRWIGSSLPAFDLSRVAYADVESGRGAHSTESALRERQARTAPSDPPTLNLLAPPASMRRQRCVTERLVAPYPDTALRKNGWNL